MQLIFETEPVNITSNMSALEDVLGEKPIANGILENLANDISIGNKENSNKSANVIRKKDPENKTNNDNVKCSENEATVNSLDKHIKMEIDGNSNTSVIEENNDEVKTEKQDICEYQRICIKYEEQNEKSESETEINTTIKKEINEEAESTNENCNLVNSAFNLDNDILNDVKHEIEDINHDIINLLKNKMDKQSNDEMGLPNKINVSDVSSDFTQSQQVNKNNISCQVPSSKNVITEELQDNAKSNTESTLSDITTLMNDKVEEPREKAADKENNSNKNDTLEAMDIEIVDDKDNSGKSVQQIDDSYAMHCDVSEIVDKKTSQVAAFTNCRDEIMVVDEEKDVLTTDAPETEQEKNQPNRAPLICRLSNTLDILSDDEDEPNVSQNMPSEEPEEELPKTPEVEKSAINLVDDDDIVVIDEEITNQTKSDGDKEDTPEFNIIRHKLIDDSNKEAEKNKSNFMESIELSSVNSPKESTAQETDLVGKHDDFNRDQNDKRKELEKPLIAEGFVSSAKKKFADMTREELEDFCVLKIVESIVDRSNLSEIKTKLKTMAQTFEEYNKKTKMLTKQNRDLQVILKSIQEEQKRNPDAITPLKITRSVGMQVLMIEKPGRKKGNVLTTVCNNNKPRSTSNQSPRSQKSPNTTIPVPRLIPANNVTASKSPVPQNNPGIIGKQIANLQNGTKPNSPTQKLPEKRPLNKGQSTDCVDLTDDEPPAKVIPRNPTPPVRLVPSQNLLAPQRPQFGQTLNSPRKVYIPISSTQGTNIRPGQTFMVKTGGPRQRAPPPNLTRAPQNQMRFNRVVPGPPIRHPAPLPDAMKQYQPPNWKALPPAPTLKLSKVENGIVISWKIEGISEDNYEEIASYQLYAYQETASPPSTALWKKIGDVKALPLPMACTLTQFMAGFKYYFAVRAVDIRSRLGPFSVPGSILLLNKM